MGPIGCKYFAYKISQNKMIDIQINYLIKKLILNNIPHSFRQPFQLSISVLSGYPGILAIGNTPIKFNISILVAVTIRKTTLVGT